MLERLFLFYWSIFLLLVLVSAVPDGPGMNGANPAFGKVTFELGSCFLGNDDETFVYLKTDGEKFMTFSEYRNYDGYCDTQTMRYVTYDTHTDLTGKLERIQLQSVPNHCTCAGKLTRKFQNAAEDVYCFSKAHVLCNNGEFVSILAQPTEESSKWFLFFAMKTGDNDLDERSGYNEISGNLKTLTSGKYCDTDSLGMFETITWLNSDLSKNENPFSSWTCTDDQDPNSSCSLEDYDYGSCPEPTFNDPAASSSDSSVSSSSSSQQTETCKGTPPRCGSFFNKETCNPLQGCSWILGFGGTMGNYGYYTPTGCYGTPQPCSQFHDSEAACIRQGCTYESSRKNKNGGGMSKGGKIALAVVGGVVLVVAVVCMVVAIVVYRRRRRSHPQSTTPKTLAEDDVEAQAPGMSMSTKYAVEQSPHQDDRLLEASGISAMEPVQHKPKKSKKKPHDKKKVKKKHNTKDQSTDGLNSSPKARKKSKKKKEEESDIF